MPVPPARSRRARRPSFVAGVAVAVACVVAACGRDGGEATGPARGAFQRYVAIGTGVSMGAQSDGVHYGMQLDAWPQLLARAAGASPSAPLVRVPGCPPPLLAPLSLFARLDSARRCAARYADAPTLPGDVAILGATTADALHATPASVAARRALTARDSVLQQLYARVLPTRETQVTAMLARKPTLVAVELGGAEVRAAIRAGLPALAGSFEGWAGAYDSVVSAVVESGARALLVGVGGVRAAAGLRRGAELHADSAAFAAYGVTVAADCRGSENLLFVPDTVVPALAAARAGAASTLRCTDRPGEADHVLTPADTAALDALVARMDAHIDSLAQAHAFAYLDAGPVDAAIAAARPSFTVDGLLTCDLPYGTLTSLDGVRPSMYGQRLLAAAAATALGARYDFELSIPSLDTPPTRAACAGAPSASVSLDRR